MNNNEAQLNETNSSDQVITNEVAEELSNYFFLILDEKTSLIENLSNNFIPNGCEGIFRLRGIDDAHYEPYKTSWGSWLANNKDIFNYSSIALYLDANDDKSLVIIDKRKVRSYRPIEHLVDTNMLSIYYHMREDLIEQYLRSSSKTLSKTLEEISTKPTVKEMDLHGDELNFAAASIEQNRDPLLRDISKEEDSLKELREDKSLADVYNVFFPAPKTNDQDLVSLAEYERIKETVNRLKKENELAKKKEEELKEKLDHAKNSPVVLSRRYIEGTVYHFADEGIPYADGMYGDQIPVEIYNDGLNTDHTIIRIGDNNLLPGQLENMLKEIRNFNKALEALKAESEK